MIIFVIFTFFVVGYEIQKASYYNEDRGNDVAETEAYGYDNTQSYTHDTNRLNEIDNIPDKTDHLIQNEPDFFITQTDTFPINPTETQNDVPTLNRPLSTLIQEFSHFSENPTVLKTKPVVGYPTADPISLVLNELGQSDSLYQTNVNSPSGNTPELSTVLDQLGGYSKSQELSTTSIHNSYPYTESEFLTSNTNNIPHTNHHVITTDERPNVSAHLFYPLPEFLLEFSTYYIN